MRREFVRRTHVVRDGVRLADRIFWIEPHDEVAADFGKTTGMAGNAGFGIGENLGDRQAVALIVRGKSTSEHCLYSERSNSSGTLSRTTSVSAVAGLDETVRLSQSPSRNS